MDYCVRDIGGGTFEYRFTLILDNNDGSWAPGQGFGWIIFGVDLWPKCSPISDFVMDPASYPIGPYWALGFSSGGQCGPLLEPIWFQIPVLPNFWIPAAVGDKLEWKGTSKTLVTPGGMHWCNVWATGGAPQTLAVLGNPVPCDCYPDCNAMGGLTVADFACFQTKFVAGDPYADCNGVGGLTIADFGCFQTKFVAGCP